MKGTEAKCESLREKDPASFSDAEETILVSPTSIWTGSWVEKNETAKIEVRSGKSISGGTVTTLTIHELNNFRARCGHETVAYER